MTYDGRWFLKAVTLIGIAATSSVARANGGDTQSWPTLTIDVALSKKWSVAVQGQARLTDNLSRIGVTVIRPSIGYRLSKRLSFVVGYSHIESGGNGARDIHEDNIFEQASWTIGTFGALTLRSRSYLEQRWSSGGSDAAWRLRQRIRVEVPLGRDHFIGVVSSEGFAALNSTDWGVRAGFDQVRNFVGVNAAVAKGVTVEFGYLNRYQRRFGVPDRDDHVVPVIVSIRL